MLRIWDDVFNNKWHCRVDKVNANNGILIVYCNTRFCDFEPRGLVMPVGLAYATGDVADSHDVLCWKKIVTDFVYQKGPFVLQ